MSTNIKMETENGGRQGGVAEEKKKGGEKTKTWGGEGGGVTVQRKGAGGDLTFLVRGITVRVRRGKKAKRGVGLWERGEQRKYRSLQ